MIEDEMLAALPVGAVVPIDGGRLVKTAGYDPVEHNLFGIDVLHQDDRWKDGEGNVWLLDEMRPSHRANLLAFLRRRAVGLAWKDSLIMAAGPMAPRGDAACDAMESLCEEMWDDPAGWLEGTRLVTRLRELVAEDDARNAALATSEVGF